MNLIEWLDYLERLHPKSIDLGLERVSRVAQKLNLFPWTCPTITVTGTNGKGSCVAILESILSCAGYRVGAYTSPHLFQYNERIRIQGKPVSDDAICAMFERIEVARGNISLTYFEFGTLAALLLFQQANLDKVILEVGLGGRLDAVNIIDADIAIITTIALDHMDYLGHDREAVAREKVAIARPNRPIICGDESVPASVYHYAQQISAPLYCQAVDFGYERHRIDYTDGREWFWWGNSRHLMGLPVPTLPLQNMATALKAIELLTDHGDIISEWAIKQGLQQAHMPGRFQVLKGDVTQIFDVAHNPAAAVHLVKQLANLSCKGRTFAVIAISLGKDYDGMLAALQHSIQDWYVGMFSTPQAVSSSDLARSLQQMHVSSVHCYSDIIDAYRAAMSVAQAGDRIVILGSHYTVEKVLSYHKSLS